MGREHRHHRRGRPDRRAGAADARAVHGRRGQRRAVLRHGVRRRASCSTRRDKAEQLPSRRAAVAAESPHRRAGRPPRGRRRRGRPRRPRPPRRLHRAAAQAVVRSSGSSPRPASCRRSRRSSERLERRCRCSRARPSSTATTASGTASIDPDAGRINAVLDWELCTLGDPLADVGYLSVYWTDPGQVGPAGPTTHRRPAGSRRWPT